MITKHLDREIPKAYLDFITDFEEKYLWLTFYPNTENQFSEEIDLWTEEKLFTKTYDTEHSDYQWLSVADLDFSMLDFKEENGTITKEEVRSAFVIGSFDGGFLFINLYDGSVWSWFHDMFCLKHADNFADFQKLIANELLGDF